MGDENLKELIVILLGAFILGLSSAYPEKFNILPYTFFFIAIISVSLLAKKAAASFYDIKITQKFWSVYRFGIKEESHFKQPVPMILLPPILSYISGGFLLWLAILEFDAKPRIERVSRRKGRFKFYEVTDTHLSYIAAYSVAATLLLGITAFVCAAAFPSYAIITSFAKFSIYFSFWSLIPLGKLDGTKIFFGSRNLWFIMFVISLIALVLSMIA